MRICSKFSVKYEASHNNIVKVDFFYAVRGGTEQEETVKYLMMQRL